MSRGRKSSGEIQKKSERMCSGGRVIGGSRFQGDDDTEGEENPSSISGLRHYYLHKETGVGILETNSRKRDL